MYVRPFEIDTIHTYFIVISNNEPELAFRLLGDYFVSMSVSLNVNFYFLYTTALTPVNPSQIHNLLNRIVLLIFSNGVEEPCKILKVVPMLTSVTHIWGDLIRQ